MVKFESTFKNFALVGLLILAIFSFGITLQNDNFASTKITSDSNINATFGSLANNLSSMQDKSQTQKNIFEAENPKAGFGSLILFSIMSSGKIFNGIVIGIYNTLIVLPATYLGIDGTVIAVITTILIVLIILGLWILYKLGG